MFRLVSKLSQGATMTQLHRGPYHGPIQGWSGLVVAAICFLSVAVVAYVLMPLGLVVALVGGAVALYMALRLRWRHQ
jgi:ABC-type Fe3+-siderophore transport system permease subunit